ncbi:MAG: FAD-dependent monooxygenase [Pseudomonadota bacterium]
MRVAIIGGGPAGLYLSILLARWGVTRDVVVYEQNPQDATYGFGVGLAEGALNKLAAADQGSHDALTAALYYSSSQDIENPSGFLRLETGLKAGMITRLTLLQVLQAEVDKIGLDVHYNARIDGIDHFDAYDLVVGADGANSVIRNDLAEHFGCERHFLRNRFAWYGFDKALPSALRFRKRGESVFIAHYYPYTDKMSTFLMEVDGDTWEHHGFGDLSDAERKRISEDVFEDVLDGGRLIDNKSDWTRFHTVRNRRWVSDRVALIGDALYRGHFSIGSGTRLAMQDSIGLAKALKERPDNVAAALLSYERECAPKKEMLMAAAEKSYNWYEAVRTKMGLPIADFTYDFLTRTGRMSEERLRMSLPDFMKTYDDARAI